MNIGGVTHTSQFFPRSVSLRSSLKAGSMCRTLDEQIKQLKQAIAEIEAQRSILGDAAVEASLAPIRQKLAELEMQAESQQEEQPEIPTRQRKLVTLLFMDIVGSTEMIRHLDPEDTMEIMDSALQKLAAPVEGHGGHVTRFMGDELGERMATTFWATSATRSDPLAITTNWMIVRMRKTTAPTT